MPIVPSRSREIEARLTELASTAPAARDSAIARLTLLGERAVGPLVEVLRLGSPVARLGAIKVLEQLRSPRALPGLIAQLADGDGKLVSAAAVAIATLRDAKAVAPLVRALTHQDPAARAGAASALASLLSSNVDEALEPLLETLLDPNADERLRGVAGQALSHLPARELRALRARVAEAADERRRPAEAAGVPPKRRRQPAPDVSGLLASLPRGAAALTALHRALQATSDAGAAARLHQALAERGSRIALYDLRERLDARPARAAEALLEAAARIGDASLVPSIVALAADRTALTGPCADALAAIVSREKLRKSHHFVKAVPQAHRKLLDGLWSRAMRRAGRAR